MFDIGFSELMVIGVVALLVIGPERLPKVARQAGTWIGRLQRYVSGVKADIAREMELDELRKFKSEIESSARDFESSVSSQTSLAEQEIRAIESDLIAGPPSKVPLAEPAVDNTPVAEPPPARPEKPQLELGLENNLPSSRA